MGKPEFQLVQPPRLRRLRRRQILAVALQVAFERQILKPVFHLIGYGLWVNLIQRAEPHLAQIRNLRRVRTQRGGQLLL
jgi:hypothetical protein